MSRIQGFIWQMDSNTGIYVYLCLKMHYVVAVGDKIHNRLLPWRSYTTLNLHLRGDHSIVSHCHRGNNSTASLHYHNDHYTTSLQHLSEPVYQMFTPAAIILQLVMAMTGIILPLAFTTTAIILQLVMAMTVIILPLVITTAAIILPLVMVMAIIILPLVLTTAAIFCNL